MTGLPAIRKEAVQEVRQGLCKGRGGAGLFSRRKASSDRTVAQRQASVRRYFPGGVTHVTGFVADLRVGVGHEAAVLASEELSG